MIKTFEEYKIKSVFGNYTIFPDFFKGELFDYYNMLHGDDTDKVPDHLIDKDRESAEFWNEMSKYDKKIKKDRKKKKKEILGYINDYNANKKITESVIEDFNFVTEPDTSNWRNFKIKTISVKTYSGTYNLDQKTFEDITLYLSDPEMYLDTKKYNL